MANEKFFWLQDNFVRVRNISVVSKITVHNPVGDFVGGCAFHVFVYGISEPVHAYYTKIDEGNAVHASLINAMEADAE